MLELMLPALVAALILVGIHGYLGIHIIARGVIFVDLALAQVAAMGWAAASLGLSDTLAGWLGLPESIAAYGVGLAATLVAAALFSVSRMEHAYVPQEAIIGIVYVVASAVTILLAAQAPRGSEHVEELLSGSLLWVSWPEIWKTALIYALLGGIHWLLRDRFLTISMNPDEARRRGWSVRLWDFVFYGLFGVVVTSSVAIAGVLLVFSFLVIPAVIAFLFTVQPRKLITIAWSTGTFATVLGLYASYRTDLPTGPTVVCAFALVLLAAFAVRYLVRRLRPPTPAS
ncbi:MAG: metal ABC transporter permease [Gemmatimonadetes bacterium]|uniref:Metal ABC transporter permease n=1 Tax=Candidatus Kutchimonas denitrificans TaxID=3056748 RepID=A0AAE4Z7Y1_9BACT|nr:metal ABC transporter permease [Gemmatimonadota bacterium]NIR75470.1 metal ABC transporter permease [Candidatus Kutchimonas denitrificans]NIS01784.1 metal ABC transporter permease [Gemmatimonadota bacterium]NIT67565.1 metal ABC transporter permease [Gemmatimonadota bacterium]NIU53439.1 iron chelate uptake ABC transporter family permease subunit [Gemmatimonadota bacterium]